MKKIFSIPTGVVIAILGFAPAANGEVKSFPFDEPMTQVQGEVDFTQDGKSGTCATFTGAGCIELTEITFDPDARWTIAFWVKGQPQTRKVIVGSTDDYWNNSAANGGFSIFSSAPGAVAMHTSGTRLTTSNQFHSGEAPVLDGTWHHFAYVKDGSYVAIYVDGERSSTKSIRPDMYQVGNKIKLFAGGIGEKSRGNFIGSIDELKIIPQALPAAKVQNLAGGASPGLNVISQRERDYTRMNEAAERLETSKLQVKARELKIRDGLPNFFAKAKSGEPLVIAYFGGSITAHPGWRPDSFERIQAMFPESEMTMINASVGGTGSVVGAFRADKDLVSHKPDLVFIEFAVNDGSSAIRDPERIWRAQEGIIRKLRKSKPDTDICFFYTMQGAHIKYVSDGMCHPAVAVHEKMADHYKLPSIYVAPAAVEAIDEGTAVFSGKVADRETGLDADGRLVITADNTHPVIPTGHAFYAEIAGRSIKEMSTNVTAGIRPLPTPMMADHWEKAKTIPVHGNATFEGNWEKLTAENGPAGFRFGKRIYDWFPFLYRTETPGSSFTVRFEGTHIGFKGVSGPDSGFVISRIDGQPETEKCSFNVYCTSHAYSGGPGSALADGIHTVTWTLSDKMPDKLTILESYHHEGNEQDMLDYPEKYATNRLSVGEIVLIGDIVE